MGDVNLEIKLNNLDENVADVNIKVDEVSSVIEDNGDWLKGKNLLPCTVSSNGIFTVNTDGSVKAKGTPSGTAILQYNVKLPIGSYILNGCPSDGSNVTYSLQLRTTNNTTIGIDTGNGYSFTLEETKELLVLCRVASGVAVDVTYYPMIRKAGTDSTYVPYVKSNVELDSDLATLTPNLITGWTYNTDKITYIGSTNVIQIGKIVIVTFNIGIGTALSNNDIILSGLPKAKYRSLGVLANAQNKNVVVTIKPNETVIKVDIASDATSFTEGQLVYITE